jgi:hypothetical protein
MSFRSVARYRLNNSLQDFKCSLLKQAINLLGLYDFSKAKWKLSNVVRWNPNYCHKLQTHCRLFLNCLFKAIKMKSRDKGELLSENVDVIHTSVIKAKAYNVWYFNNKLNCIFSNKWTWKVFNDLHCFKRSNLINILSDLGGFQT